jgi:hypothetical protein
MRNENLIIQLFLPHQLFLSHQLFLPHQSQSAGEYGASAQKI